MSPATKFTFTALPVLPKSQCLQHNLTPDPLTRNHKYFKEVLTKTPSVQRRARLVDPDAHFSFVTPLHLPFPYRIQPPNDPKEEEVDKAGFIERWLTAREPLEPRPSPSNSSHLTPYSSAERDAFPKRELLGLSHTGIHDCLPHLDVGRAFDLIGSPALNHSSTVLPEDKDHHSISQPEKDTAGDELVDVLGGHTVLMRFDDGSVEDTPYFPWSLRYSGHQFGVWAGQLGDGRAISILETAPPDNPTLRVEIQLKGVGRTPYSRSADGLAVLRSSIREYLCAEAMHALGIPTTRSLALISVPKLQVERETEEPAAVVSRMAPSFLRIGSFQTHKPPEDLYLFGLNGRQQTTSYEGLRVIGEWVTKHVLKLDLEDESPWGKALLWESARRNAIMVAGWQAYGFMHGVMNTDNISILGLTIDYGPYAFMDIFNRNHICNHSDHEGRYAYQYQPTMIVYALRALLKALAPLIGAEMQAGKRVKSGWADGVSERTIKGWEDEANELQDELDLYIQDTSNAEYRRLLNKRFGLKSDKPGDSVKIHQGFFGLMERHELDFHSSFRTLLRLSPSALIAETQAGLSHHKDRVVSQLLPHLADPDATRSHQRTSRLEPGLQKREMAEWLHLYSLRVLEEQEEWGSSEEDTNRDGWEKARSESMKLANPRFVLRQWLLEEVIRKCEEEPGTGKQVLAKVMEMATRPFDNWGAEYSEPGELSAEAREERRYCGLGEQEMLGFQCSCSS